MTDLMRDEAIPSDGEDQDDPVLAELVAEVALRHERGEPVDIEEYARRFPDHAERMRRLATTIRMMAELDGRTLTAHRLGGLYADEFDPAGTGRLGDYQVLREVGRGGMGVVYEARQVSLNRRVALKVLPCAAAMDPRQLQRFRVEAQAAACLNHAHIVPIFAVDCDRGIHYYAMQLIEGRSLSQVIRELRRLEGLEPERAGAVSEFTRSLAAGQFAPTPRTGDPASGPTPQPPPKPRMKLSSSEDTPPSSGERSESTILSGRGRSFARTVAKLGLQAAEALEHAHQNGILHRDVKPSNLLLDEQGNIWVADFGLARFEGDSDLIRTGDLLGTLRYMSPERALGRRLIVDHRTDIYSLGTTVYELLTLRPAFGGDDRPDLLRAIAHDEPCPPRRICPAIPPDLETIVLKAMAKEPGDRYGTAQALADDLRRFLGGRPIRARRPYLLDRVVKWARRNRSAVASAVVVLVLATIGLVGVLVGSNVWLQSHNQRLKSEIERADRHARDAEQQRRLTERHLYATSVRLANQALDSGQIERAQDILDQIRPGADGSDPRGFAWHYLRRLARREIVQLRGHQFNVRIPTLAPDGRTLASADDGVTILLWDPMLERPRAILSEHATPPSSLAFSPDSQLLASAALTEAPPGSEVVLWDAGRGKRQARIDLSQLLIDRIGFLAGGRLLGIAAHSSATKQSEVRLYDLAPDPERPTLRRQWNDVGECIFLHSERLFGEFSRGKVELMDAMTGVARWSISKPPDEFWWLSSTPDGRTLATAAAQGKDVILRDAATGSEVARCVVEDSPIASFALRADGAKLAVWCSSGRVVLWDRATGRSQTLRADELDRGHRTILMTFSPDGTRLALSCWGIPGGQAPVTLWEVATGRKLATFPGRLDQNGEPLFTADGRSLFLNGGSTIRRWRLEPDGGSVPPTLAGHANEAWAVVFSPDGRVLASGSDDTEPDDTIKLWDAAKGQLLAGWRGHPATVSALAFSPDGRTLASAALHTKDNLRIWDAATRRPFLALAGHTNSVYTVTFSPDGSRLASAGSDRSIRLWDPVTGHERGRLLGHTDKVRQIAFSPDGRTLASASNDRTIRLWDVATGAPGLVFRSAEVFTSVVFSADGATLAAAGQDGIITLWDAAKSVPRGQIHGAESELLCLAFSPDGGTLAAAGKSHKVRLWDPVTGQELLTLEGHKAQINSVTFSPDGSTLASCSHDGVVRLWRAGP